MVVRSLGPGGEKRKSKRRQEMKKAQGSILLQESVPLEGTAKGKAPVVVVCPAGC